MIRLSQSSQMLTSDELTSLNQSWLQCMEDILYSTTLSGCGHPGGSMSSLHLLLIAYGLSNITPDHFLSPTSDNIIISHGHISPAVYSVLAQQGFFDREEMVLHFRKTGSRYGGHVEDGVPGVEWNTGNLGQGLSVASGAALAHKIRKTGRFAFAFMGDGEQQKGQISEARRFASKNNLSNLISVIDYNRYQIGGNIQSIMPQDIAQNYLSDGWNVVHIANGHDFQEVYAAFQKVMRNEVDNPNAPTVLIAHTIMGFGVSFMSDICDYHGKACSEAQLAQALSELNCPNRFEELKQKRAALAPNSCERKHPATPRVSLQLGSPRLYLADELTDNRSAYGHALGELGQLNHKAAAPILGLSCDLEGSVKMNAFHKFCPDLFFECGIQEHHTAVLAGSLSKRDFQVFFSTFGVFGVDEVYNQQRLNGFNETNVKTVCTHLGLDVGEDGPTHQSIDYIGLLRNVFGYEIILPADPNQTDRAVRYAASVYGNVFIGMGRSKVAVICDDNGQPFFNESYVYQPGKWDLVRSGCDGTIISYGPLLSHAVQAADKLKALGKHVRVLNAASIAPFDKEAIIAAAKETKLLITVEDHHVETGVGSIVANVLAREQLSVPFKTLGVDRFSCSGQPAELYARHGLDVDSILKHF